MGLKPIQIPDINTVEKADDFLKVEKAGPLWDINGGFVQFFDPFSIFRQIR